jgi:sigma-B regulation protein RsbU (phosphoserine phosphatase)
MPPVGVIPSPAAAVHPPRLEQFAPPTSAPAGPAPFAPALIEQQVEAVAREVDALREELEAVRRRDEALNAYLRRMDEELRLAARLQQDFLPKEIPEVGRVRFHTLFRPAGYVSGDLYDVMRLDEKRVGFYMADAVGHGVPAALLTMFIKQALQTKEIQSRGRGYRLLDPGEALRRLNERLLDQNLSHSTFATALYGTIDVDTLEMTVARAGHPHPIVLRAGGAIETLAVEGCLLGVFPDETFANYTTQLHPGDRMLVYTDGMDVAFAGGAEGAAVETPRWQYELVRRRHLPVEQILAEFSQALDAETASLRPKDDVTMVVVEVTE